MAAVDSFIPTPARDVDKTFLMPVEDVFTITGRGTVATGRVERGKVNVNDEVEIIGLVEDPRKVVVTGLEMFRKLLDYAESGDNVGVLLRGVERKDIERGQVLAKPGTIKPHTKLKATVYALTSEEGGRHKPFFDNYRPQFYFRTTDVTGVVKLPSGTEMVMPGDNVELTIELIKPIAVEQAHDGVSMKKENKPKKSINLIYSDSKLDAIYNEVVTKMEYVNFARDLQDLPPNIGTSVEIANRIEAKAKKIAGLKVTVYTKKQIEDMKMGLLLSVNAGSSVEPRVVVLEYIGDPSKEKVAFVGKGICFDSGGYNLKPSNFLKDMKFDMSGAAIMSATVMALAASKAKCNVASIAMLTDNRIGHTATLTESVITSMNGLTVQIDNTDAEGRLVLADGITYAVRNLKADKIIDLATLTGAIVVALGS
ncbi:hypothetical protein FQR65_LT18424 [Abscondita terminalis]|nr:hypothetical protein FQR65_LT18424 [Abscondita terminalis]